MPTSRIEPWLLAAAMLVPTLVTWCYFSLATTAPDPAPQLAYLIGKSVQFALPVVGYLLVLRRLPDWSWGSASSIAIGVLFGAAVLTATWFGYGLLANTQAFLGALEPVREKVTQLGIATPGRFVLLGCFYALCHSFLEEYYWRWYVFARLRSYMPDRYAMPLSAAGFALHHVLLVGAYFWSAPWVAAALAGCVMAGGVFWAWLYSRSGSLIGPWLSHLLVDAGIFAVGYRMVFPAVAG